MPYAAFSRKGARVYEFKKRASNATQILPLTPDIFVVKLLLKMRNNQITVIHLKATAHSRLSRLLV